MENTNNIMIMLSRIESSLNELTRRVNMLEGRQDMSRPMYRNPFHNTNPFIGPTQIPGFMSNEMSGSYGNNPRGPQPNPQYKVQYNPQYTVSRGIDELKSIKKYLLKNTTNDDDVFNKINAIERTLLDGLNNLQYNYNYSRSVILDLISISKAVSNINFKHCFDVFDNEFIPVIRPSVIPNLNAIKHDINILVRDYNIETVNTSNVNNSYTAQPVGKENLSYMEEWVNNTGYKFQQPTMSNYSNGYNPCINRQMYPPIIDTIIKGLTTMYNVKLTVFEKNALNKLKSLDNVPEDIYDDVNNLYTRVIKQECTPENLKSQLKAIKDMMYARGYMKDFVNEEGTVNDKPTYGATSKPKEVSISEKIEFIKHVYTKDTCIGISKEYQDALDWLTQQKNLSNDISDKINMIYIKIIASRDNSSEHVATLLRILDELSELLDFILVNIKPFVKNIERVDQNSNVKKPTTDKSKPMRQQVRKR